jgi:hypothetical protein
MATLGWFGEKRGRSMIRKMELEGIPTLLFGPIHGGIGVPEEIVNLVIIKRIDRDPNADAD